MRARLCIAVLLGLILLPGCALTASAWQRGTSGERFRGGALLHLEQVRYDRSEPALLLAYHLGEGVQANQGHLPTCGWLTLRPLTSGATTNRHRLVQVMQSATPIMRIDLEKHRRGRKVRWQADLCYAGVDQQPRWLRLSVAASPEPPRAPSCGLARQRFPSYLTFRVFQRRSRAQLLSEAILLTPPLLLADLTHNIGHALSKVVIEIDLVDLLLDSVIDRGKSKHGAPEQRSRRRSARRHRPSGPARLSQHRARGR